MAENLKPCPFCGSEAVIGEHENMPVLLWFGYFPEKYYSIQCKGCGIAMTGFESEHKARSAWSRRVNNEG